MAGTETFQASCVSVNGRGILITGQPGSGKSSLALSLIDRGATLVGDDAVILSNIGGSLVAAPHPNTENLFEIRNVGLVKMAAGEAPIALLLELAEDAPRFIDAADFRKLCGISIPSIKFWPGDAAAPIRAEWALTRYGLGERTANPSHPEV
ncbi:HPr kinase/phosphatase C-terminal domain-containing protein [Altererythrobacter aquiaggeris]|uniref:HPr kinase/phosphorylase n=1 Tax=Aestuarierythrobacter aquiaggeris TaxID=1898396 RepID=UPI00301AA5BA